MIFTARICDWQRLPKEDDSGVRLYARPDAIRRALDAGLYADYKIEAKDREHVYEILNINHPADYRNRSMSVGDLVVEPDGDTYIVCGVGWEKLAQAGSER